MEHNMEAVMEYPCPKLIFLSYLLLLPQRQPPKFLKFQTFSNELPAKRQKPVPCDLRQVTQPLSVAREMQVDGKASPAGKLPLPKGLRYLSCFIWPCAC